MDIDKIVKASISKSEVCRKLGLDSNNGNDKKKVGKILKDYDISHFTYGKSKYTLDELKLVIENSSTYSDVCRKLNIKVNGGNFLNLKKKIKTNNIDITHFTGKGWNIGDRHINNGVKYELSDLLVEFSTYNRGHLKKRLINEGILEYKCVKCGNEGEWMGEKITLQLDHINGVNDDNRLNNLRILCPNCHSQTSTFAGKNNIKSLDSEATL